MAGPVWQAAFPGEMRTFSIFNGYWGVIPYYFAIVALVALCANKHDLSSWSERFVIIFFSATCLLMILKRFGNILVNWVGSLPIFELILFQKYQEPLMALCVSMLAGSGISLLTANRVSPRTIKIASGIVFVTILVLAAVNIPRIGDQYLGPAVFSVFIGWGVAIAVLASRLSLRRLRSRVAKSATSGAILILLVFELNFNFLVPTFYAREGLAPVHLNPYSGAPYIDFVRTHDDGHVRVFGREGTLHPNWSAVFKIADPRSLDALLFNRYRSFVRSFLLAPGDEMRVGGDLADRFTGTDFAYSFRLRG